MDARPGQDIGQSTARLGRRMLIVSSGIMLSRVLGLLRDVSFASAWGTGIAFAAFNIAFTIPNLFRALFGEGAFAAAFVPTFTEHLTRRGKPRAWAAAQKIISVLALVLCAVVLGVIGLSLLLRLCARSELDALTLRLLPWLMPYAVLVCVTGALSGVLNSLNSFAIPAVTSVVLNLALIAASTTVCPYFGDSPETRVFALALAVLLAGCLQLGLQLYGCRRHKLAFGFDPDWRAAEVRQVAFLIAPVLIGTGVTQINVLVDRLLAKWLGHAAVGALYYSQRLVYLPVGLFGVALAVVCLPSMSRAWARSDRDDMLSSLSFALRHVLFLTLPVTAGLAMFGPQVIRLLFERGSFDATSTAETVWAFRFYLPGIPAFACAKVAATPFHARKDTTTPVKIAALCLLLNVALNLTLMWPLRQGGLALATTLCSYVNAGLLLRRVRTGLGPLQLRELLPSFTRTSVATLGAAATGALAARLISPAVARPGLVPLLLAVAVPLGAGALAFLGTAALIGCPELHELLGPLARRVRRGGIH